MAWLRVWVVVDEPDTDLLSELFQASGALSETFTPVDAANGRAILEPGPGETPRWPQCRMEALFPVDADLAALRRRFAETFDARPPLGVGFLAEEDWQSGWRTHAVHEQFGGRLWVLPRDVPQPQGPTVRLDPGLAFGTGSHPTTQLCLTWLAMHFPRFIARSATSDVLDYGCGSGILALAALALGAERATAVDHDPQALLATAENAAYNRTPDHRLTVCRPDELAPRAPHDLVMANILANTLIELAPTLQNSARVGGYVLLSGVLQDQVETVRRAYPLVEFATTRLEDGWACMAGRRLRSE